MSRRASSRWPHRWPAACAKTRQSARSYSFRPRQLELTRSPPPALQHLARPDAGPLHLARPEQPFVPDVFALLRRLAPRDLLVPVELGLFSEARSSGDAFEQYSLPLETYLDWLQKDGHGGQIGGKQVYLAQWDATGSIPGLADALGEPPWIEEARTDGATNGVPDAVDVYQKSFFIGPMGATTPLHHDPHHNLFLLPSASHPRNVGKAFLLFPPSLDPLLRTKSTSQQRNTSDLSFDFVFGDASGPTVDIRQTHAAVADPQLMEQLSDEACLAILREGEALVVPKGFWHCVKNVSFGPPRSGWTAGIGWWFRLRC